MLTPPSPTILHVPPPGWVWNTTNQPWVHYFSACTSCWSFEPNSCCSRLHWLKGQGSNWLGDWLCLMDGDSHHDWNKNPVEPNSRMPMNAGWLLEWNVSLSLSIHSYADSWGSPYSPKIIVASKRKPSKFTEIKNPRVLAPCGSGATQLLLVPGNVPPKVWKHRPPSAKSLKKSPETSAISARKEVTLKIGKKTCPCRNEIESVPQVQRLPYSNCWGTTMTKTHQKSNLATRKSIL